jgi:hypothetical protein
VSTSSRTTNGIDAGVVDGPVVGVGVVGPDDGVPDVAGVVGVVVVVVDGDLLGAVLVGVSDVDEGSVGSVGAVVDVVDVVGVVESTECEGGRGPGAAS